MGRRRSAPPCRNGARRGSPRALGIPAKSANFNPHLTLARSTHRRRSRRPCAPLSEAGQPEFGRARPDEFHLYQSVLSRGGAEYTRLASYQISGESACLNAEIAAVLHPPSGGIPLAAYLFGSIPFGYLIVRATAAATFDATAAATSAPPTSLA